MTAVNLLQKYFKQLSYYTALVLYLDTSAKSNQIKYFTANREMQYGLFWHVLLADLIWLVAESAFTRKSRKTGT